MKYYNFNEMEECLQEKMLQCFYPWVTFRDLRELPGDLDYAPSLGPFLFNDIGLDGVGAFVHYHCYIGKLIVTIVCNEMLKLRLGVKHAHCIMPQWHHVPYSFCH